MAGSTPFCGSTRLERQQRKSRKPVLAHIIASHVTERRLQMPLGRIIKQRTARVIRRQRFGDRALTPRSTQIEPVQMRNLPVAAIRHRRGCESELVPLP